jgi:L-ascorbate metabolism protein UlaG (beta-lactamase superfamily)
MRPPASLPLPTPRLRRHLPPTLLLLLLALGLAPLPSPAQPRFDSIQARTNGQIALRISAPTGQRHRLETSPDLAAWSALVTFAGAQAFNHTNGTLPSPDARFYRVRTLDDATALTGDHLGTSEGDVVLHPVNHASLVLQCLWNGLTVYVDPVGGAAPFSGLPRADLILVTHGHGDHFHGATLDAVGKTNAFLVAPAAVYASLSAAQKARAIPLANGMSTNVLGLAIDAIPAYNANHPKGVGNGYLLGVGGRRLYFAGDTGDIPEMRALTGIDVAFVCMNIPFTMTVAQASAAVRAFAPRTVYPYHFRNQDGTYADLSAFARQVGTDLAIEVRPRQWY